MLKPRQLSSIRRKLLRWFEASRRDLPWRRDASPYHIWVSEVMLQQTQVAKVIPYYLNFVEKFPDIRTLARAELDDVLKSWENLGYYARARNLHRAARIVADDMSGQLPCDYDGLRRLPGIGDYIAAAVLSIAHNKPHPVLDGNVKRVLARLFVLGEPVNRARKTLVEYAEALLDRARPGDFNQAMMELGATVCRPRAPRCEACPVSDFCGARVSGRQDDYPVREPKRSTPHYHIAVGVVQRGGRILITRRPEEGLLGGLWEFPGGKVEAGESAEAACRREIKEEVNVDVEVTGYLARVDHAYSHFRIGVDVFTCEYKAGKVRLKGATDHRWILIDEIDRFAFPGANHKFIPILKSRLAGNTAR